MKSLSDELQLKIELPLRWLKTAVFVMALLNVCFLLGTTLFNKAFYSLIVSWEEAPFC